MWAVFVSLVSFLSLSCSYILKSYVEHSFHFTADPGYIIKLDFRDYFHIEQNDECKFDFLEVRLLLLYYEIWDDDAERKTHSNFYGLSWVNNNVWNIFRTGTRRSSWLLQEFGKGLWQNCARYYHVEWSIPLAALQIRREYRVSGIQGSLWVCAASRLGWVLNSILFFSLFCETWVFSIYLPLSKYNSYSPTTAALYDDMECGGTIDSSDEGFVNSSFISKEKIDRVLKHNLHLECMWMIKVREGFKVSSLLLRRGRKRNSISVVVAKHFQLHFHSTLTIFFFFHPFLSHRHPSDPFIFSPFSSREAKRLREQCCRCVRRENWHFVQVSWRIIQWVGALIIGNEWVVVEWSHFGFFSALN